MQYTNGANVNHKERKFKNNKFYCQGNHFVKEVISTSRAIYYSKINLIGFFLSGIYGLACKCDKYCSYGLVKCYNRDFLSFYMNQNIITRKHTFRIQDFTHLEYSLSASISRFRADSSQLDIPPQLLSSLKVSSMIYRSISSRSRSKLKALGRFGSDAIFVRHDQPKFFLLDSR